MEVQVAKLREALDLIKPVIPRKPKITVMASVLLGNGEAVGGDLESAIVASLPEAQEVCLVPFEAVTQLLKYVPGRETATITVKRGKLSISWSDGSASYPTVKTEEYPPLPELQVASEAEIDGDSLISAITSVLPYCAKEDSRPVLSGITMVLGETIQVAAGDGFRMAYQTVPLAFPSDETLVIPAGAVSLLLHLWAKTPRTPPPSNELIPVITAKKKISLAVTTVNEGSILRVGFGDRARLIIKLVQGNPPDWLKLVPTTPPILQARVLGSEFERAVRRVQGVASSGSGIVRLEFSNSTMTVSARAEGQEVKATVPLMDCEGEPNKVAINVRYLLDYLSSKESIITISMTTDKAPVSFQHLASPRVMMMPMFVQW